MGDDGLVSIGDAHPFFPGHSLNLVYLAAFHPAAALYQIPGVNGVGEDFIRYACESNAPEANSMTLEETRAVPEAAAEGKDMAFCAKMPESMRRKEKKKEVAFSTEKKK